MDRFEDYLNGLLPISKPQMKTAAWDRDNIIKISSQSFLEG